MLLFPMSPYGPQTHPSLKSARAAGAPSTLVPPQSLKSTLAWGSADTWQTESRSAFTNPTLSSAPQPSYIPAPLLVPQLLFLVVHLCLVLPLLEEVRQIHLAQPRSEPFGQ